MRHGRDYGCFSALQRAEIAEISTSTTQTERPAAVSVLFNEPKLLKSGRRRHRAPERLGFSALQRAEIAEMQDRDRFSATVVPVSVLFNEPKLLKYKNMTLTTKNCRTVSVLFNEPKLLKL